MDFVTLVQVMVIFLRGWVEMVSGHLEVESAQDDLFCQKSGEAVIMRSGTKVVKTPKEARVRGLNPRR